MLILLAMHGCTQPNDTPNNTVDTDSDADDTDIDSSPLDNDSQVVIVIHADPNQSAGAYDNLVALVDAAAAREHVLTIQLGYDWAERIHDGGTKQDLAADWLAAGHEIGLHRHDCSHIGSDRFVDPEVLARHNQGVPSCNANFSGSIGSADDAAAPVWALLDELGAPTPYLASQGPDMNDMIRDWEWQPEATFATGSIDDNTDGHMDHAFLSTPTCHSYSSDGGQTSIDVAGIGHQQLALGSFGTSRTLEELESELEAVFGADGDHKGDPVHLGIVFHAREYDAAKTTSPQTHGATNDKEYIEAMFDLVATYTHAVPVRDVLTAADPCAD
jgi:hypothetical protein